MVSDYKVRIMRSEIHNIKNVSHGEITYMNYGSINRDAVYLSELFTLMHNYLRLLKINTIV